MNFLKRIAKRGPVILFPIQFLISGFRFLRGILGKVRCVLYGVKLGPKTNIGPGLRFVYPWNIEIKEKCIIGRAVRLWCEDRSSRLVLECGVEIGRECVLDFTGGLTIGEGTLISEGAIIYTHDHGYDPHSLPTAKPLIIGKKVWIGARAIILASVKKIGDGAIVGAGAIVSKNIPNDVIYVSQRGRVLNKRKK